MLTKREIRKCTAGGYKFLLQYEITSIPDNILRATSKICSYFPGILSCYVFSKDESRKAVIEIGSTYSVCFLYFSDPEFITLHNTNGPAVIEKDANNEKSILEMYFVNGVPHRDNGPQTIRYYPNTKNISTKQYVLNGVKHRNNDKPAYINYYKNGNAHIEIYHINGSFDRINDQPTLLLYNESGLLVSEEWRYNANGETLHRMTGPAVINHYPKTKKYWYINNKLIDRRKLPAFEDGKLVGSVKLTKSAVLDAALFDREYGAFLNSKLSDQ